MVRRRNVLLGLSASCGCAVLPWHVLAQGRQSLKEIRGCTLRADEVGLLDGRNVTSGLSINDIITSGGGRRTTGNREMDRALDRAIKRLADTFEVFPGFGFFDDAPHGNALAVDYNLSHLPGTKGLVLFGDKLFADLMRADETGTAIMWVIAHEFAHIWLYANPADMARLGNPKLPRASKRIELHADYLAGFYVGQRQKENAAISLYKTGSQIWDIGDTDFNNPAHHGTPPERLAAAEAGFKISYMMKQDAKYAYRAGLDYVLSL